MRRPATSSGRLLAILIAAVVLLAALPAASAGAASPWWQVLTGSRPTNLWVPQNQVQEINAPASVFVLSVEGTFVGPFNGAFPEATAANVQTALEGAYGAGNVAVTGGPGGTAPLIVTSVGADAGKSVAPIESPFGATTKIVKLGGSGRLVLTITNLGDAPVDGTGAPVTITDELPAGVLATGAQAFAGAQDKSGPVSCAVETSSLVSCSFAGVLPSYESIEVEILASLTGEPPTAGAPGRVTVAGGNAPSESASQAIVVSPERTPFGIEKFSAQSEEEAGVASVQAGAHPFQLTTTVQLNSGGMVSRGGDVEQPAQPRNFRFPLPVGLVGNATAVPRCALEVFYAVGNSVANESLVNECPAEAAIGVASVTVDSTSTGGLLRVATPVFNLPPAQGEPARFGFTVAGDPILIDTAADPDDKYRITASVNNATQLAQLLSSTVTLWGTPGDPRHDASRGWSCVYRLVNLGPCQRPDNLGEDAFLRQPVSCQDPLEFQAQLEPWNSPIGGLLTTSSFVSDRLLGCNRVPFQPEIAAAPTSGLTTSSSGMDFQLDMPNLGLLNSNGIAEGQAKKVEVTLPAGMTLNPSAGENLVGCSPAAYASERASSAPGAGCPEASKVGTVQIATPLLDEEASGSVYVATPHDNPFDSLFALYMVARIPERGILIKQAGKVIPDPDTGQLTTTFDDLPQLPFSIFKLHLREGDRAPLVTPPTCGIYPTAASFTPWSATNPSSPAPGELAERTSPFAIDRGVGNSACPAAGTLPFQPGLVAGTLSNAAGHYSPFSLRLTRADSEPQFERFSVKLPPGVIGKLAGIPFCSDAAIAAAKARTGPNGGEEELAAPSCPAASQLGHTLVGAGVGSVLSYVPGKLYLAGPYRGSRLSIVAITAAKVGPFDLGTVVVREGLRVNPDTAEVFVDPTGSDPIPRIVQGVVVHVRDIRVYADRPEFVLNPTNCARTASASTVQGSEPGFGGQRSVTVTSPFQAANCASLDFKPKLVLSLKGGTKRGDTPRLKAVLTARKGDANIGAAQVTLPHSEFLEQAHIKTVCTRVQFAAGEGNGEKCPPASVYGRASAVSPLLDEPLAGPVYLRSSNHKLPDLVVALHSAKVDINLAGRIDSVKNARIRTTFAAVPDAPVTRFTLEMQGGKKGLLVNSTNLCRRQNRAAIAFTGQNGKRLDSNPVLKASCGSGGGRHRR